MVFAACHPNKDNDGWVCTPFTDVALAENLKLHTNVHWFNWSMIGY